MQTRRHLFLAFGRMLALAVCSSWPAQAEPVLYRTEDGVAEVRFPGKPFPPSRNGKGVYTVQCLEEGGCEAVLSVVLAPLGPAVLDSIPNPLRELHCGPVRGVEFEEITKLGAAGVYTRVTQEYVVRGYAYLLVVGFLGRVRPEAARQCLASFKVGP